MGQCHNVDMYGIYKICDAPNTPDARHHEEPPQTIAQPEFMTVLPPIVASFPPAFPAPAPPPDPVATPDGPRRDLSVVDDRLHQVHLLLNDKHAHGEITADFFDEEIRLLAGIERHEQSDADANGDFLSVAQETTLLQKLQDVENEINQNLSSQS